MNDAWITWIIQGLTGLAVGAIGFFLKRTLTQLEAQIKEQKLRIDSIELELKAIPLTYTLRDDFLRTVANFDKKLDKILDKLAEK